MTEFGAYTISVVGPGAYSWQTTWNYDGSQLANSWMFTPASARGDYTATVTAPDASVASSLSFHVDQVSVTGSSLSPSVFFPLERDGHRDFAHFYFRTDARASDTVRVANRHGRVVRRASLGSMRGDRTHLWKWDGRTGSGRKVNPGRYTIWVTAVHGVAVSKSAARTIRLAALPVRITRRSVGPTPFYPVEQDGDRDTTTFRFGTNLRAVDTIQVINRRGVLVRQTRLGKLGGHRTHAWTWNGRNSEGRRVSPGGFRIRVVAVHFDKSAASSWLRVEVKKKASGGGGGGGGGGDNCTSGYSPCLVDHGGADYDCYGGSGNGPYYTAPGVVYSVTGSDPYGLDADNDGNGCE